jgi:hypothetical protein
MTIRPGEKSKASSSSRYREFIRRMKTIWKWVSDREELNRIQSEPSATRRTREVTRWLFGPERLPQNPQKPDAESLPLLPWFTAREKLSHRPADHQVKRPTLLRWVVSAEPFGAPGEPISPKRARSLFSWLLDSEPLKRVTEATSNREATHNGP